MSTHYRSPIQYSEELLEETARSMETFYRYFKRFERITGGSLYHQPFAKSRADGEFRPEDASTVSRTSLSEVVNIRHRFLEAMDDDFNTGVGVAALFDLVRLLNKFADAEKMEQSRPLPEILAVFTRATATFRELAATLGLFLRPIEEKSSGGDDGVVGQLMQLLIDIRTSARQNKDFTTADTIRKRLTEIGVTLEDRPTGTEWTTS